MNEYGEVDEMRSEGARIYAQKPNLGQRGITWSLSVSFSRSPPLPLPPPRTGQAFCTLPSPSATAWLEFLHLNRPIL